MAQTLYRLTAKSVISEKVPGRHADGGNLYLSVSKTGSKSWSFFYRHNGRMREMGLGSINAVGLAEAREKAAAARNDLANGIDPLVKKHAARNRPGAKTFGEVAEEYIAAHAPDWRNSKHQDQWKSSLTQHASALWKKPVDQIQTPDVVAVLDPIWLTIAETARRVRGRIETVLDSARAKGLRAGENPARWRGHLDHFLAKKKKRPKNQPSMDFGDVPAFLARLRTKEGVAAVALQFSILTAARSGEVRGATWSEFDLENGLWTIPAERMKAGREHRVPLAHRAREIIEAQKPEKPQPNGFVFPGARSGSPLSDMSLTAVLRRMDRADVTAHGFRSSFREWAGDKTNFPREIAEAALAHQVGDKVERAYRRGDALEKRAKLMDAWSSYCSSVPIERENIVPFGRKTA